MSLISSFLVYHSLFLSSPSFSPFPLSLLSFIVPLFDFHSYFILLPQSFDLSLSVTSI